MKFFKLSEFTKGWFVGDFEPSLFRSREFEVSVKRYKAGDVENTHYHKVATEWTCVIDGKIRMSGFVFEKDDIIQVDTEEIVKFEAIEDSVTVVVKTPSLQGDKYEI